MKRLLNELRFLTIEEWFFLGVFFIAALFTLAVVLSMVGLAIKVWLSIF